MLAMDLLSLTLCLFVSVHQGSEWPGAHTLGWLAEKLPYVPTG